MAKAPNDSGILLESGTNEFEVLLFKLGEESYGVNVAKVREIITPTEVTSCPDQPPAMLGMISLRGSTLPLISLHNFFEIEMKITDRRKHCVIVTEFSEARSAFLVEGVEQIFRASWNQIQPMPEVQGATEGSSSAQVTGILKLNDRLIPMLDFESIYAKLFKTMSSAEKVGVTEFQVDRPRHRVFIADDSASIRKSIALTLRTSGYTNLTAFSNGAECWEMIQNDLKQGLKPDVVVTDIEMPLMDGLALTRNIKSDPRTKDIPVILFSSLISDDNRKKGEKVGANEQLAKPQIGKVVELADKWISHAMEVAEIEANGGSVEEANESSAA
ncbi:MAG: chemotaxis protein CheV [Gammaproteobacteria bacterium]|nr:chemotaxis protein CheV [Gammaproteobacteria bacterium]